jgi:5'-3' exonuclease
MPILMDYSQVMLSNLFVGIGTHTNIEFDENILRHMFLNSLKHNRKKFTSEYGEMVICVDGKHSWRRDIFPYYKASRRKSREESELDWTELFKIIDMIKTELDENFPYKVIQFDNLEADDIIASICNHYGKDLWDGTSEKILVLSGDKDYVQLQKYANIDQYSPVKKEYIKNSNPHKYLTEHVLKGDSSDGVPNILSPDNCFVIGERQKMMTAKRLETFSKGTSEMDELTKRRYERNKKLIDLSEIPREYQDKVIEKYKEEKTIGRSKLLNFFIQKRLKGLMGELQDF